MARDKLHGVEHRYLDAQNRPIEVLAASIGFVVASSADADASAFPVNQSVLVNSPSQLAGAGTGALGTMLQDIYAQQPALVIAVRVDTHADPSVLISNLIGRIDNETNSFTGMQLALAAESQTGFKPRLFIAEGSHLPGVGVALEALAIKLGGIAIIDGQSDGLSAAIQDRSQYSQAVFIDNGITRATGSTAPASATALGHIVRNDNARGYWTSPSNQRALSLLGPAVPVDYTAGSKTSLANVLSANDICTFVRKAGGTCFWGNRLANGTLIPHQRLRYIVGDSIRAAHDEYVDRQLTSDYVLFVRGRVNQLLRRLTLEQVISGGECWIDPELNRESFPDNTAYWDYKLGFYNVAETMIFRQSVTDEYTNQIIDRIAA